MTGIGFEALAVLLVLLPGFLAARIVQTLCVRPSQSELDKIVEALLYSFLIYIFYSGVLGRTALRVVQENLPDGSRAFSPSVRPRDLLLLVALSLLVGLLVSASVTNDWHGWLFRKARLTQRTTRSSVWSDVFHDLAYYVQVQFTDGRKLIGWPKYFSDTPEESSLFLENAAWIDKEDKVIEISGPGILITKNMPVETIMFLKGDRIRQ